MLSYSLKWLHQFMFLMAGWVYYWSASSLTLGIVPLILQLWQVRSISLWLHFYGKFEHLLICLLVVSVTCLVFGPFLNWIAWVFFLLIFRYSYLFQMQILSEPPVIYVENTFSHSVTCFPLFILSFSMPYF